MKKILVPTDFSPTAQNALRYAILFSKDRPSTMEIINVIPPEYQPLEARMVMPMVTEEWFKTATQRGTKFVENTLLQVQTTHQLNDLPNLKHRVEIGLPVSRILDIVKEENFELIILGTQGEHSRLDRFLGSVSTGVVKNAKIPVLVIPEHANFKTIEKVTIAVDLKESDPWEIFKATSTIGDSIKEVDLLHVHPTGKMTKTEIKMKDLEVYFEKNKQPFSINFFTAASDNLNAALNNHVTKNHSDLLVMLGPHLSSFKKMFFQSNTNKMTYQSKVPFLRIN